MSCGQLYRRDTGARCTDGTINCEFTNSLRYLQPRPLASRCEQMQSSGGEAGDGRGQVCSGTELQSAHYKSGYYDQAECGACPNIF